MAQDRHPPWVSTEVPDVELDPLEGGDEVSESVVARGGRLLVPGQQLVGHEAQDALAHVDSDPDHALGVGEGGGGAQGVVIPRQVHHHRQGRGVDY